MKFLIVATLCFGLVAPGVGFSKSKKSTWCCMIGSDIAKSPGKKAKNMCVRSKKTPTEDSKSKLVRKYAKSCTVNAGVWQLKPKKVKTASTK